MQRLFYSVAAAALLAPGICAAQTPTLEQLVQRIDALEQKVADLEREKQALLAAAPMAPPVAAPPAYVAAPTAPPPPMAPVLRAEESAPAGPWSGPYFGLSASYRDTDYAITFNPPSPGSGTSLSAGPQIGYRWQGGPFVTGLEFSAHLHDNDYVGLRSSFNGSVVMSVRTERTLEARAMAGVAVSNWLGYGFWGLQNRVVTQRPNNGNGPELFYTSEHTAPIYGGGLGYMFPQGSSVEFEYSYSANRTAVWFNRANGVGPARIDGDAWTLRLNQKF